MLLWAPSRCYDCNLRNVFRTSFCARLFLAIGHVQKRRANSLSTTNEFLLSKCRQKKRYDSPPRTDL